MPGAEHADRRTALGCQVRLCAIVDPDFRQQLRGGDPHAALKSIGIEPTDDLVNAVGQAMGEVDRLSSQFGDIKAAT